MEAYLLDWLNLLGRWLHIIVGIAWIGASFYFVWLDNHLLPPTDQKALDKGVSGELWAVHGGGFYNAQKYRVAPGTLPEPLHWFKWEAYWTWMTGMFMLGLVYYVGADVYLVDKSVAALTAPMAIGIGIAFLAGGWIIYDRLCASPLGQNTRNLSVVLALLLAGAAWALCHLFSGRGAYIHFGAMLGTIMAGNVVFVIMPGQRELVEAKLAGTEPDPVHGLRGKQRSVHNTYFTLPVLFTMISNHYALTYGAHYNWLVLIAMVVAGAAIRAWFVSRHKFHMGGRPSPLPLVVGIVALLGVIIALRPDAPSGRPGNSAAADPKAQFAQVQAIVAQRCAVCHAAVPTQPGFAAAPKGVMLDTPERIVTQAPLMRVQLASKAMPIGNLTNMTDAERTAVLAWIDGGTPH